MVVVCEEEEEEEEDDDCDELSISCHSGPRGQDLLLPRLGHSQAPP